MILTFEANSARDLYRQIADFLEAVAVGRGQTIGPGDPPGQTVAGAAASEAAGNIAKPPTPAVKKVLDELGIPEPEYPNITRSGKNGNMTQGDVREYAAKRTSVPPSSPPPPPPPSDGSVDAGTGDSASDDFDLGDLGGDSTDQTPAITADEVKASLKSVFDAKGGGNAGREACIDLLSRYGVKRVTDVLEDRYADFVAHAARVVAGEPV